MKAIVLLGLIIGVVFGGATYVQGIVWFWNTGNAFWIAPIGITGGGIAILCFAALWLDIRKGVEL